MNKKIIAIFGAMTLLAALGAGCDNSGIVITNSPAVNAPVNAPTQEIENSNTNSPPVVSDAPKTPVSAPAQTTNTNTDTKTEPTADLFLVSSVVDGDTVKVNINGTVETLRLIGIDTPEVVDPRKPVQCFGVEASNKAKELLSGKSVRLEADPTQGERDIYGRLLRYVFLSDGTNFDKLMIEQGYAYEYTYNLPYKYQTEFKQAETYARETNLGLWSPDTCNGVASPVSTNSGTNTNTNTNMNTNNSGSSGTEVTGHTFYTSSYGTAIYYYCDTDTQWQGLSPKYLQSFPSAEALLAAFPDRVLHEPCK